MDKRRIGEPYRLLQVVMPQSLYGALHREAAARGVSMASLVRSALEKELSKRKEVSR